ncbi:hypothetical protein DL766_010347 [Monosporascus sp. MC13-8B]|uniref:Carrier domain-containing protein n=1 Tax=Monosporascus cannonballus TaxID=155416 RepID=A0ABY0HMI3_9PEZI|nr:hypothetical protein DL763_004733 [Monosporascus cannonballus]RYO94011.1 hypothetical protein DL762_000759 [Monosporascus cannonballus]RYP02449.1 hypothetical protein DL766_010347 [Monosporascus sp. MC13-8B]
MGSHVNGSNGGTVQNGYSLGNHELQQPDIRSAVSGETRNGHILNGNSDSDGHPINGWSAGEVDTNGSDVVINGECAGPQPFTPIAVCGMACRLPGGISSPQELWDFLLSKGDARTPVPETRYNIRGYHFPTKKGGHTISEYGYFLDESVDLGALDTSVFPMPRSDLEHLDPQQRILLEVSRECLDDAGEVGWKGKNRYGAHYINTSHDFALSNRVSYEMDLRGPSLIALNEACAAVAKGDCPSAIVGGTSIIMTPGGTTDISNQGALSPDGSCKTFSSAADGYARGEGIVAIYVKPLREALQHGNPIRAVIVGSAINSDGKTPGFTVPSSAAQESLIRHTYKVAGIPETDVSKTGLFECHGTGTPLGDSIETSAIARVFGETGGIHIGSVKPNLGHGEGVSGLTSVLKAVLALENRIIPPNIKCLPLNKKIPFESGRLTVPTEETPWPEGRYERVSINSFGIGGANAHVILDSATRFRAPSRAAAPKRAPLDAPQLLVYSANTSQALKDMTERYSAYLERAQETLSLADVAYTLANRREHLPFRSFAIGRRYQPGVASPPSPQGKAPSIVMVFTGQGSQWPQMGRELLRISAVFRQTIKSLDAHLQSISSSIRPDWKIEDELVKPPRTSRVNKAEFSQPLCTAIQIALVRTLASNGIKPSAVVGHSSGEIAAAYAAAGLTAEEAITAAFCRGLITKSQTRPGGMAAVGLSWEETEKFLLPGVVVACENSPRSVTISGDADKLQEVVAAIKQALPTALTSVLKVEKAYHSHHMLELGDEYHRAMVNLGVKGAAPSLPFFSSVTGGLLVKNKWEDGSPALGPSYWRKNLESPVLFNGAVSSIIRDPPPTCDNPVFLEIGPHAALLGPLRQILTSHSSTALHIPTLMRRQNGVECFLTAVGKLWTLHAPVDLATLMPEGTCLPDLPRYPWNHQRTYWSESRVAREWRMPEHPYHDLLGAKVPESSGVEPVWRNLLHLDNAPWLRDHKIKDDIIFPFAGYVAMAAEAVRQVTGVQEAVELRHVTVTTALVISEGDPAELITTFRRHRLTDFSDSPWWEFSITAHNGHTWTKHCFGEVRASSRTSWGDGDITEDASTPHKINVRQWYERVGRGGLRYGHHFRAMEQVRTSACGARGLATAKMRNNWHGDEARYHLHPVVLDTIFQLIGAAAHHGFTYAYRQGVPSGVDYIALSRCSADDLTLGASCAHAGGTVMGDGSCVAGSTAFLKVSGARFPPLDGAEDVHGEHDVPITARSEWVPHIDFIDVGALVRPVRDNEPYFPALEELAQSAISLSRRALKSVSATEAQTAHIQRYKVWLEEQSLSSLESLDAAVLTSRIDSLCASLAESPATHAAKAIAKICTSASSILSGDVGALDVLHSDGTIDRLYEFLNEYNASDFLRCLANSKPSLRIVELGTGQGPSISSLLKEFRRPNGQVLYSEYVYTDKLTGLVTSAQERHQGIPNLEFATLDISKDPGDQGFQGRQFDLMIANGVIHETSHIHQTLEHVRKLLSPDGRLLLLQPREGLTWIKYVLGTLPGWWCGAEDGRDHEPYITQKRWEEELVAAGFDGLDGAVPDSPEPFHLSTTMVAKLRQQKARPKRVTLLRNADEASEPVALGETLKGQGFEVSHCKIDQTPTEAQDVIALVDETNPFFESIDTGSFESLKKFIQRIGSSGSGVLWVTRPSQTQCSDPRYAPVIGLARTVRSEMGIDFATCEADDLESEAGLRAVIDVFCRFHERDRDGSPDFEYAIAGGVTRVNRFFPFTLSHELEVSKSSYGEFALRIGRPARLDSLYWAPRPARALKANEVEIEVHVVGLNFRDVLEAMGVLGLLDHDHGFGYEASGIVRRIGSDVAKVRVGDRVIVMGLEAFQTTLTTPEFLCEKLPYEMSFAEGASMPVVFLTAIHSLVNLGRLEKGQSVLIHSGCGGVGLASIQVARMLGAEIYTTVGNKEKADYLMETCGIPRGRIFDSRNTSFVDGILRETNGKGVDVALNSLSGELLHATWRCIAKWGTMVEIGKVDLLGAGKLDMDMFLGSRNYCCFDLRQMAEERPQMIGCLLRSMMEYYHQGFIRPIHLAKISPVSNVQDEFRYMQQGSHIGKIMISLRDNDGRLRPDEDVGTAAHKGVVRLDPSASYLLVGGLGGLGRSISAWMVQHNARNLTFLSRSAGSSPQERDFARTLESMGCTVQLVRGSVTDAADVARAMDGTPTTLKGIIHMAMVLRDQAFSRMSIDDWNGSTAPKITGTWNLHQISCARGVDLDFFILFSSLSGVLGQPGQANYAAANTFLDAFVKYRTGMGLPCTALDIGAMEGIGYLFENEDLLRKMRGTGWHPVKEEELLEALGAAILARTRAEQQGEPAADPWSPIVDKNTMLVGVSPSVPLGDPNSSARLRKDVRMAAYLNIGRGSAGKVLSDNDALRVFLASAKDNPTMFRTPEGAALLAHEIGKKLFALLLKPDEDPNIALSLAELGLDSLIAVEMRAWWKQVFGLNISVLEILAMGTLDALGKRAADQLAEIYDG